MTPTKRGAEKVLAMLKEVGASFGVVLTRDLEVLAIVMGCGHKKCLGGGAQKVLPCLEGGGGGGCTKFRTRDFPIL